MSKSAITSISLPPALVKEVERVAKAAHQTKSGVVREALRYYFESRRWKRLQRSLSARARELGVASDDDIEALIDDVRA